MKAVVTVVIGAVLAFTGILLIFGGAVIKRRPCLPSALFGGDGSSFTSKTITGPLDDVPSRLLYARAQVAPSLRALLPEFSTCLRCEFPVVVLRTHGTMYERSENWASGSGCFPLCEDCWIELRTPEARMPYYMKLVDTWEADKRRYGSSHPDWKWPDYALVRKQIQNAVAAEESPPR